MREIKKMDISKLHAKLRELETRNWDRKAIENRCSRLMENGIPAKTLSRDLLTSNKEDTLDRVQRRGEEYNYLLGNCARSTALAVMEEFGLGSMETMKALGPLPACGGTGWMCGGVTGGLVALGLYGCSDNLLDQENMGRAMASAQRFMARFEAECGAVTCRKIHEDVVFGRYMDPGASPENMKAFERAKGFEKCSLLPGIGARIAAEIIIETMPS